jgi:hypothetical protein
MLLLLSNLVHITVSVIALGRGACRGRRSRSISPSLPPHHATIPAWAQISHEKSLHRRCVQLHEFSHRDHAIAWHRYGSEFATNWHRCANRNTELCRCDPRQRYCDGFDYLPSSFLEPDLNVALIHITTVRSCSRATTSLVEPKCEILVRSPILSICCVKAPVAKLASPTAAKRRIRLPHSGSELESEPLLARHIAPSTRHSRWWRRALTTVAQRAKGNSRSAAHYDSVFDDLERLETDACEVFVAVNVIIVELVQNPFDG